MLKDFVLELCSAPGTAATVNLAGAVTGRLSFAQAFSSGVNVYYFMDDGTQAEWGWGVFTAGTPNTVSRSTVVGNTAGNTSKLNFAGSTRIYNSLPSSRFGYADTTGNIVYNGGINLGGGVTASGLATSGGASIGGALALGSTVSGGQGNVFGFSTGTAFTFNQTGATGATALTVNLANTSSFYMLCEFGGLIKGSIATTGTATLFNTTSDYRLKVTFGEASGDLIGRVRVHDAAFTTQPADVYPMVLAHELAAVAPFAVIGAKDAVDDKGEILPQQVDHSKLIPALIAYVQRLERRIADLESR